jgi:hypothetical protein
MSVVTTFEKLDVDELSEDQLQGVNAGFLPLLIAAELAPAFVLGVCVGIGVGVAIRYAQSKV